MSREHEAVGADLESIEGLLQATGMLRDARHLIVGCSGGGDSVALAGILRELRPNLRLTLLHCDHGARPESGDDAAFVETLAADWDLECRVVRFQPVDAGAPGSREARWRDQRRTAYREAMEATGADAVALGHTLDDQAETVILNLARGAGLAGMAGMEVRAEHSDGLVLVRPLLGTRRGALRRYAEARGYPWRRDPTNDDLEFSRNRVRAAVMPQLEKIAPGVAASIARLADIAREQLDHLDAEVDALWPNLTGSSPDGALVLRGEVLASVPRPVAMAALRRAIGRVRGDLSGISKEHLDGVLDGVLRGEPAARDLPGVRVRLRSVDLLLQRLENRRVAPSQGLEAS
jgi:tRNA(Ile)-lysidine synthetase-like protein